MFHEFGHALHGLFASQNYPTDLGHQRGARLRRVPLAVQRALGARSRGAQALRGELQDRRSRSRRRWSTRSRASQTWGQGYALGELLAAAAARHAVARAAGRCAASRMSTRSRPRRWPSSGTDFAERAAALPLELFPAHLGQRLCGRLLRLSVDARCWTTTPMPGSRRMAA